MTCIVAIEEAGTVHMGGDRASSNSYYTTTHDASKVFEVGPLLIGICGSWRMGQVLQYGLTVPTWSLSWDVDRWIATDLMAAVRQAFETHAWNRVEHGVAAQRGVWLCAVGGRCYAIQGDYSWQRHASGEYATGSGEDFALGSLHSTRLVMPPELRVRNALLAAAEHSPSVAGPFDIVTQQATV